MISVTEIDTQRQDGLPDDWESLVAVGMEARETMDGWRWLLGDAAVKVGKRYGEDALGTYAGEINVVPRTLRSYRATAAFYPLGTRGQFPNLTFSHYRDAARLGDLEEAMALLERASADNWTWRELTDHLNNALGKPPVRRPIIETEAVASERGIVVSDAVLVPGVRYQIKVYANE